MTIAGNVSIARLRECLAGTRLPEDPTRIRLPTGVGPWPDDFRSRLGTLKPAGVLIPIIERAPHMTVLLTRRSAELRHHASQVSFPGGSMEAGDRDIQATALRETHEEIGVLPAAVQVLGCLEPMPTLTGFAVTPVVGVLSAQLKLDIDRSEVDVAFEVPLDFLLDTDNAKRSVHVFHGRKIPVVEFHFGGHRIWGATANMLVRLHEKIKDNN